MIDVLYKLFGSGKKYLLTVVIHYEEGVYGAFVHIDYFAEGTYGFIFGCEAYEIFPCVVLLLVYPFAGDVCGTVGEEAYALCAVEVFELHNYRVIVLSAAVFQKERHQYAVYFNSYKVAILAEDYPVAIDSYFAFCTVGLGEFAEIYKIWVEVARERAEKYAKERAKALEDAKTQDIDVDRIMQGRAAYSSRREYKQAKKDLDNYMEERGL